MATEEVPIFEKDGMTIKELFMNQLSKVVNFCNVEFRGGYYQIITTKTGEEKEHYVPDTREVFCNSLYALAILAIPQIPETEEVFEEYRKKLKIIKDEFLQASSYDEEVILGDSFYESQQDKILLDTYKNKRLNLTLSLFLKISKLIADSDFLKPKGGNFDQSGNNK